MKLIYVVDILLTILISILLLISTGNGKATKIWGVEILEEILIIMSRDH